MSHEMSDGRPCGLRDGHSGKHASTEVLERTRVRNRERYHERRDERRAYSRAYYLANKERLNAASRAYHKKNHDTYVCKTYGLEPGEYAALKKFQGGKCAICQRATGRTKRLSVDHCHKTRAVRGVLCHSCNHMLGHLRDSQEAFQRAIDYLNSPPAEAALGRIPLVPEDSVAQQRRRRR